MLELQMLSAAMMNRGCYNLIDKYIEPKELSPETQKILKTIGEYYERDPSTSGTDRELIEEAIYSGIPEHNSKHKDLFRAVFDRIPKEVSPDNLSEYIIGIKRSRLESELHQALLSREPPEKVSGIIDKWNELRRVSIEDQDKEEVSNDWNVRDLVREHFDPKNLIKFLPVSLNKQLDGGAKPGHHVLIYAFTEVGKTLFKINLIYGFLKQNLRVLDIANEEPIADLKMRLINRITGMQKNEVRENPDKADTILADKCYSGYIIAGLAPGNFEHIRKLTKEYDPHIVILDQLGNLDVGISDSKTHQLNKAASEARSLGKAENRLVISIAQASNDADNRPELRKNDVQWSNVDLPGHMDLMLGIGCTEEMEAAGLRRISKPKNKLSGCHKTLDVRFIPELSKVEELANG